MRAERLAAVYITTNRSRTVPYTGVTNDLYRRVAKHKLRSHPASFTARYNVDRLVYLETTPNLAAAIAREKRIKAGSRAAKIRLIEAANPEWNDLAQGW